VPSPITDGVIPGNEGRGYVLRRIARRAIRHGYKLGARKPFFHTLVMPLAAEMGDAYPELRATAVRVTEVLKQEEERFFQTIANGMEILEGALAQGAQVRRRRDRLQAARHLRLSARPDGRRLPRARRGGRRGRLPDRDEAPRPSSRWPPA
jgi:alanyl-tRNA synthetase